MQKNEVSDFVLTLMDYRVFILCVSARVGTLKKDYFKHQRLLLMAEFSRRA